MRRRLVTIAVALLLLIVGAGAWWYLSSHPDVQAQILAELGLQTEAMPAGVLAASGMIEAEEVSVTTETGGRVAEILAGEGDAVDEGQIVIRLDDAILQAQIAQADGAREAAQARLAQVRAGVPEAEIRQAEALVAQAEVARDGALQALRDAQAARADPQELEAQIDGAHTQLAIAKLTVEQAIANMRAAETEEDFFKRTYPQLEEGFDVDIPVPGLDIVVHRHIKVKELVLSEVRRQGNLANQKAWMAWEGLYAAEAALEGARQQLNDLLAMRDKPLEANAMVSAAQTQYDIAEANVGVAQAQVDALKTGASEEELRVAEAQLDQAEAALETLKLRVEKMTLRAPRTGVVLERMVNLGEIAPPKFSLLTIADLNVVTLKVYIPENQIGLVKVGQAAHVKVDSFPERSFDGEVVHIAAQAEFTPKNVQTKEERVSLVFAVKIEIPNPDHALKPGMPADAQIVVGK